MKHFMKEWGGFLLFITLFILSRIFVWNLVTVDGHSMDPTLQDTEKLLMVKVTSIDRFDIVVASEEMSDGTKKNIVKRVIGMPGDTIRYENDTLYINDVETDEPYLSDYLKAFATDQLQETYSYNPSFQQLALAVSAFTVDAEGQASFTVQVPEREYFLMGDDRIVSKDSRSVGTFERSDIEGEIVFRVWPFNQLGQP